MISQLFILNQFKIIFMYHIIQTYLSILNYNLIIHLLMKYIYL